MPIHICSTCGTSYPEGDAPPPRCPICDDERQYVPRGGQAWTTREMLAGGQVNAWRQLEADLLAIHTHPGFGIGQRALLLRTPEGNILWDCISLLDDATETLIRALGGLRAIAISHPHYYSSMVEWAQTFDVTVHLHAADRQWVMRPDDRLNLWEGESLDLGGGMTLLRAGGHFEGGTVLHWQDGAQGRGALLAGDILQVVPDRRYVSFMYSYPNLIPLPAAAIRHIAQVLEPFAFDRIYGAWWDRVVESDGKACVERSVARYLAAIAG